MDSSFANNYTLITLRLCKLVPKLGSNDSIWNDGFGKKSHFRQNILILFYLDSFLQKSYSIHPTIVQIVQKIAANLSEQMM